MNPEQLKEHVLSQLQPLEHERDREKAGATAEAAICYFLQALGYGDVAKAWDNVPRL